MATLDNTHRENEFFVTWLKLMERLTDGAALTHTLQTLLAQPIDPAQSVALAKQQADAISNNDKLESALVAQLNEFFYRDIVPALKKAKQVDTSRAPEDALDQYLQHGDNAEENSISALVSSTAAKDNGRQKRKKQNSNDVAHVPRADDTEEDSYSSEEDIPSDQYHDLLIRNSLRLTSLQAPDYAKPEPMPPSQPQQTSRSASPRRSGSKAKSKRRRMVPPPIETNLPPSVSGSAASTPMTQTHSPDNATGRDRIDKKQAEYLLADQVLSARSNGTLREYLIKWRGVETPLWIARRKAPQQAKVMIDLFLRGRDTASSSLQTGGRKKNAVRHGTSLQQRATNTAGEFYMVDHIVKHRTTAGKRQYLVRWENYDESEDTWEDAAKLRADVPEVVDEYEEKIQREQAQREAVQYAISQLNPDRDSSLKPAEKSEEPEVVGTGKRKLVSSGKEAAVQRYIAEKEAAEDSSEDERQIDVEEQELDEFSDNEFSDKLNW